MIVVIPVENISTVMVRELAETKAELIILMDDFKSAQETLVLEMRDVSDLLVSIKLDCHALGLQEPREDVRSFAPSVIQGFKMSVVMLCRRSMHPN